MSTNTILIICFAALIVVLLVLLIAFIVVSRRNSIPKEHRRDITFTDGADVSNGMMNVSRTGAGFNRKLQGTILISVDGTVTGINDSRRNSVMQIRRLQDNVVFDLVMTGDVTLGRIQNSFIEGYYCVTDSSDVSKYHCSLKRNDDGSVLITDLNSTNHTYVNGIRIEGTSVLRRGDVFRMGHHCDFMLL